MIFAFFVFPINNHIYVNAESLYTPTPPIGNTTGDINVEHEYVFYTSDVGSYWKFDWGDGSYSEWIKIENSDNYISQIHSWSSYGLYKVRIKHKDFLGTESSWSLPLNVKITPPPDMDGDGWLNEIEESYDKDPKNPNDYPLDTDGDGTPDNDSIDGKYKGDIDDDNDGLSDIIEEELKLNPINKNDIINIEIDDIFYFLIDINGDGNLNILYNKNTKYITETNTENKKTLLDINNDGLWDYTYFKGSIKKYESEFPWLILMILIISIPIIIVILLFKTGILFLYQEEYIEEE
jgi:hypothetical protein